MSAYRVTPFVGIIAPQAPIMPDSREVEDVFETPLTFLMNSDNHVARDIFFNGRTHRLYDMPYQSPNGTHRNIWGMTAMIMYRLYQRAFEGVFDVDY